MQKRQNLLEKLLEFFLRILKNILENNNISHGTKSTLIFMFDNVIYWFVLYNQSQYFQFYIQINNISFKGFEIYFLPH